MSISVLFKALWFHCILLSWWVTSHVTKSFDKIFHTVWSHHLVACPSQNTVFLQPKMQSFWKLCIQVNFGWETSCWWTSFANRNGKHNGTGAVWAMVWSRLRSSVPLYSLRLKRNVPMDQLGNQHSWWLQVSECKTCWCWPAWFVIEASLCQPACFCFPHVV